jgi:hypothetical protein
MGVERTETIFSIIKSATCDCCGEEIKLNIIGELPDHVEIGGYREGLLLSAIVCTKCMDEKLGFIDIQKRRSTVGYC